MKLYAINGISLAGKDSFVERVQTLSLFNNQKNIGLISTIDPIKDIYRKFFKWDEEKTPGHRMNLNLLKQIWIESCNGPEKWTIEKVKKYTKNKYAAIFVMVREYEELINTLKIGNRYCEYAKSIVIVRDGLPIPEIEMKILNTFPEGFEYDIVLENKTTDNPIIPNLWKSAHKFIETEKLF